jgi:hypothetical protein
MHHPLRAVVRSCAQGARPAPPEAADEDAGAPFVDRVARCAGALQAFIIGAFAEGDGGRTAALAFLRIARARRAVTGARGEAAWLLGIAAVLSRELACPPDDRAPRPAGRLHILRRVSARLALFSDDLHDLLLLVALDALSIDDAGLLLPLPARLAARRIDHALRALQHQARPAPPLAAA